MNFWPKVVPQYTLIETMFHHIIPKNLLFSHISVNIIQHPLLKNPDTDSYQDIHSNSPPPPNDNIPFEQFQSHTSTKPIAIPEPNSHFPPTHQNHPQSPLSHDNFDDSFYSTDSDSELLHNPVYHSASFSKRIPSTAI